MSKIIRPFCYIGTVKYQLHYSPAGTLRFPNTFNGDMQSSSAWLEYINHKRPLQYLLGYYTTSGCSYELVYGIFSKGGINNENIKKQWRDFAI